MRFRSEWQVDPRTTRFIRRENRVFDLNIIFWLTHAFSRAASVDPLTCASEFAGAAMVLQREFRMMDAGGDLERPFVNAHFQAWKLPPLTGQREGRHEWRTGVRPGPKASGASTNYATSVTSTSAAIRLLFCAPRATLASPQG